MARPMAPPGLPSLDDPAFLAYMHACAAAYAAHAAPQVPINPYYNPAAHQAYTDAVEKFEWSKFLRKCSTRQHALVLVRASQFCWNYGIFQHGHEFVKNFLEAAERTGKYRASKRTLYVEKFLKMMKDLGKRRKDRKIREAEEAERKRKEEEAEAKRAREAAERTAADLAAWLAEMQREAEEQKRLEAEQMRLEEEQKRLEAEQMRLEEERKEQQRLAEIRAQRRVVVLARFRRAVRLALVRHRCLVTHLRELMEESLDLMAAQKLAKALAAYEKGERAFREIYRHKFSKAAEMCAEIGGKRDMQVRKEKLKLVLKRIAEMFAASRANRRRCIKESPEFRSTLDPAFRCLDQVRVFILIRTRTFRLKTRIQREVVQIARQKHARVAITMVPWLLEAANLLFSKIQEVFVKLDSRKELLNDLHDYTHSQEIGFEQTIRAVLQYIYMGFTDPDVVKEEGFMWVGLRLGAHGGMGDCVRYVKARLPSKAPGVRPVRPTHRFKSRTEEHFFQLQLDGYIQQKEQFMAFRGVCLEYARDVDRLMLMVASVIPVLMPTYEALVRHAPRSETKITKASPTNDLWPDAIPVCLKCRKASWDCDACPDCGGPFKMLTADDDTEVVDLKWSWSRWHRMFDKLHKLHPDWNLNDGIRHPGSDSHGYNTPTTAYRMFILASMLQSDPLEWTLPCTKCKKQRLIADFARVYSIKNVAINAAHRWLKSTVTGEMPENWTVDERRDALETANRRCFCFLHDECKSCAPAEMPEILKGVILSRLFDARMASMESMISMQSQPGDMRLEIIPNADPTKQPRVRLTTYIDKPAEPSPATTTSTGGDDWIPEHIRNNAGGVHKKKKGGRKGSGSKPEQAAAESSRPSERFLTWDGMPQRYLPHTVCHQCPPKKVLRTINAACIFCNKPVCNAHGWTVGPGRGYVACKDHSCHVCGHQGALERCSICKELSCGDHYRVVDPGYVECNVPCSPHRLSITLASND